MLTAQFFARLPTFKKTPGRPKFSCVPLGGLVRSASFGGG
jgi:hypothetical protein